jgi:hypothetical protein
MGGGGGEEQREEGSHGERQSLAISNFRDCLSCADEMASGFQSEVKPPGPAIDLSRAPPTAVVSVRRAAVTAPPAPVCRT